MWFICDYSVIQKEINEEISDGFLKLTTIVQVLRSDNPIYDDYRPIVDWYYDDKTQIDSFAILPNYSNIVRRKLREEKIKYLAMQHKLEEIKVGELIREMKQHSHAISIEV